MRTLVQRYGAGSVLLAFAALCLCVAYVPPFPALRAAAYAQSGESALAPVASRLFALLGYPSAHQVEQDVTKAILVVSIGMFALLIAFSRLEALPRAPSDPETGQRPSGLGPRLLAMRVCALPLVLLGLALGSWAWLSVVQFGARGDQAAMHPHLALMAQLRHPQLGRLGLRADGYELESVQGREHVVFFAPDSPVKQLRVSAARAQDAVLELIFNDAQLPALRVAEDQCASADGSLRLTRRQLATRTGLVPSGELHISCPEQQVEVHANLVPGYSAQEHELFGDIPQVRHVGELGAVAALVILMGLALGVQGFSARYDDRKPDRPMELTAKLTGIIAFGGFALFAFIRTLTREYADPEDLAFADHVAGCLHLHQEGHAAAHAAPDGCRASRDLAFEGLAFSFPRSGELRELRIDSAREGDESAEISFWGERPPIRVRARDCGLFWVPQRFETVGVGVLPSLLAHGELHLSCTNQGIEAHITYRSCGP